MAFPLGDPNSLIPEFDLNPQLSTDRFHVPAQRVDPHPVDVAMFYSRYPILAHLQARRQFDLRRRRLFP
jgi:hypothetical protein